MHPLKLQNSLNVNVFIKSSIYLVFFVLHIVNLRAQTTADFSVQDSLCINQLISTENNSSNNSASFWDFCFDDLDASPSVYNSQTLEDLNAPEGLELAYDQGKWFAFVLGRDNNTLIRLDFGNSLTNENPNITYLGNIDNVFAKPVEISVLKENNNWYGLITNYSSLIRLDFGTDITSTPTVTDLGNLNSWSSARGLNIVSYNKNIYAFVTDYNRNTLTLLEFGSSILNPPIVTTIINNDGTLTRPFGVSMAVIEDTWYGVVSSYSGNYVSHLNFGSNLKAPPTVYNFTGIALPTQSEIVIEGSQVYCITSARNNGTYRINFLDGVSNPVSAEVTNLSNFGGRITNIFDFAIEKERGIYKLFTLSSSNILSRLNFEGLCSYVSQSLSIEDEPNSVYFTEPGTYPITLTAFDEFGNRDDTTQFITVTDNIAPIIDIIPQNICYGSASQFSLTSNQELSAVSWYIEGDTLVGDTVNYNFPAAGTYEVTLEVETPDRCGNRLTKEVTIYEQPVPKFTVDQSVVCTNGAVQFTNLSDIKGASDVITYEWSFNGEGSSTDANPVFTFTTGGTKTVSLTTTIPGCSNTYDTTFTVVQGPVVDFSTPPQICQGEEVIFENLTSGDNITAYQWSFGDGGSFSSITKDNPVYTYDSAGTYLAVLEVSNASACETSLTKTLTVYSRPAADFSADIACAGAPTQFVDESTTGINSNIVAWDWIFGDGEGSSKARNPQYTYDVPGLYEATLVVLTSAGCQDTIKKQIVVESAVQASFTNQQLCPSETEPYTIQFADASSSTNGEKVTEWLWTINGENFVIANPSYTFDKPGTYQVSLTVFSNSACNASVTRNVTVKEVPEADFAFEPKCAGSEVIFTSLSQHEGVEVTSYQWNFGGEGASFEENPAFVFDEEGTYKVSLTLETAEACSYTVEKEVVIPAQPNADFSTDVTYGGAPLTVNFVSNTSEASSNSYRWQFGDLASAQQKDTTFTFTKPGIYTVSLEVSNTLGCSDISTQTINVVEPVSDLQLERVSVLSEEGDPGISMLLTIRNNGTLKAGQFSIDISLDQVLNISKIFDRELGPGEVVNFPLDFSVSTQQSRNIDLKYICATLENLPEEENLANNRYCTSLENNFTVISPYPNPSKDKIQVDLVLPQQESVDIKLMTIQGETLQNLTFSNTKTGLNTFTLDVSTMVSGYYLLQVDYLTYSKVHRLVVNP